MKKIIIILLVILFIGIATAGTVMYLRPYEPNNPPTVDDSDSTLEGITQVTSANNKFSIDLYKELSTSNNGNLFFSPYSISSALAMTYEGADGKTAQEMKAVFYFPDSEILRPNFAAIYSTINKTDKQYELRTGNALWAQNDYEFLPEYFSTIEKYYGGKVTNLDFINEKELSRKTINNFIEEQTNNRIKEIIPQGAIDNDTKLILSNAIYFLGKWDTEFDKGNTEKRDFTTSTGTIQTSMMFMAPKDNKKFNYYENEKIQVLELPYKDKELSMIILLPKETDGLKTLEQEITYDNLNEWIKGQSIKNIKEIYLPKFEFKTSTNLNEILAKLGMPTAFSPEYADFSKMTSKNELYIALVLHDAFIKVDEKGTEAAAATIVRMNRSSALLDDEIIFKADHPFIFLIKENSTDTILFMGRITNPSS